MLFMYAQFVVVVGSLEGGLAATVESAVEAPMLQSPSPSCADMLYLSNRYLPTILKKFISIKSERLSIWKFKTTSCERVLHHESCIRWCCLLQCDPFTLQHPGCGFKGA